MDIKKILEQIQSGEMTIEKGENLLEDLSFHKVCDFAKIDHHRSKRCGFPEVIFCEGKTDTHLVDIFKHFKEKSQDVLGTRCSYEQFLAIKSEVPDVIYDNISRIIKIHNNLLPLQGTIALCAGGTSDLYVAEEAKLTAEFFGYKVETFYDIGVAGIHRLFAQLDAIKKCNCIIAVAGMEGALPGVLAGLVDKSIIAVPTSVGYGANFQGLAPLLTMLNSCAEGISVVNIDNGYGAAYCACQINRQILSSK